MLGAGFIGVAALRSRNRRRSGTQVAISATIPPASSVLVVGQALQDTTNWAAFLNTANYATSAPGESVDSVTVNYIGSTPDAATALADGDTAVFSITVSDTAGTVRTFSTVPRPVLYSAPVAGSLAPVDEVQGNGAPIINLDAGFTGENLTFSSNQTWATVSGSTLTIEDALRNGTVTVTATNSGGAATVDLSVTISAPVVFAPTAAGVLQDQAFIRGTGVETLDASADFTGEDITYSVSGVAGVSIDAGTGVLSFDTAAAAVQINTQLIVTATNSGGSVTSAFSFSNKQGIVFPLLGQSNMIGVSLYDGTGDYPALTKEYNQSNMLVDATSPLDYSGSVVPGSMGLSVQFAIDYMAVNPTHALVFVPQAVAGSGFTDNRWNPPSDDLYAGVLAATNAVLTAYPLFQLGGFLWHQGETDTLANNASYETQLRAMIAALRANVTGADVTTPFVLGGLKPGGSFDAFTAIIEGVAGDLDHTTFADASDLTAPDNLHFDAASLRILGARYYTQYVAAQSDIFVATVPDQVTGVTATPGDTSVSLSWSAPGDGGAVITDYLIEYSVNAGSSWSLFEDGTGAAPSAVVTGLTNGQTYLFRLSARNVIGTGTVSTPVEAIPASPTYLFNNNADGTVTLVTSGTSPTSTFQDNEDGTVERTA